MVEINAFFSARLWNVWHSKPIFSDCLPDNEISTAAIPPPVAVIPKIKLKIITHNFIIIIVILNALCKFMSSISIFGHSSTATQPLEPNSSIFKNIHFDYILKMDIIFVSSIFGVFVFTLAIWLNARTLNIQITIGKWNNMLTNCAHLILNGIFYLICVFFSFFHFLSIQCTHFNCTRTRIRNDREHAISWLLTNSARYWTIVAFV